MPKMLDKVCLNHTSVRAVSRCETCFRPLCEECILEARGRHYCSDRCAGNSEDKRGRLAAYGAAERRAKTARVLKNVATLLLLAAVIAGGFFYWRGHKKEVKKVLQSKEVQSALKTVEKTAGNVKQTVVRKITTPEPSSNNAFRARQKIE